MTRADAAVASGRRTPPATGVVLLTLLLVSAAAAPLLGVLQRLSGLDPATLVLTTFSTAVGALVVVAIWRRRLALPPVVSSDIRRPVLGTVGVVGTFTVLLMIATSYPDPRWPPLDIASSGTPLVVVLGLQVLGAAGEEVGWRGLVQPLLETRTRPLLACLITGLLFGVGHVVVLFAVGAGVFVAFLVAAVSLSFALGLLTYGRSLGARVVIATLLHWMVNMVTLLLFSDGDDSLRWALISAAAILPAGALCGWRLHRLGASRSEVADTVGRLPGPTHRPPVTR